MYGPGANNSTIGRDLLSSPSVRFSVLAGIEYGATYLWGPLVTPGSPVGGGVGGLDPVCLREEREDLIVGAAGCGVNLHPVRAIFVRGSCRGGRSATHSGVCFALMHALTHAASPSAAVCDPHRASSPAAFASLCLSRGTYTLTIIHSAHRGTNCLTSAQPALGSIAFGG